MSITTGLQFNPLAETFKVGTRIIGLITRHKDGNTDQTKRIFRVSHCTNDFNKILADFEKIAAPLDRIYISAAPRSLKKAARMFRYRQLDASYDPDPMTFYRTLEPRWLSCLMNPQCSEESVWFFDCDSMDEYLIVQNELSEDVKLTHYPTKNGVHIVVKPFNRTKLSEFAHSRLKTDALLLWSIYGGTVLAT